MIEPLLHNNEQISLQEYLMCESIVPTPATFGMNDQTNNHKFVREIDPINHLYTLMSDNNNYYMIYFSFDNQEVDFGGSKLYSIDPTNYTNNRLYSNNVLKLLGKIFYVIAIITTKLNWDKFIFQGADPRLHQTYSIIVKNKYFLNGMKEIGFTYSGEHNGYFIFNRV
jgi:hypothetical protein